MWRAMRYRHGIGSRRKNKRPKTLSLSVRRDRERDSEAIKVERQHNPDHWVAKDVPYDDHPTLLALYRLRPPGLLCGAKREDSDNNSIQGIWHHVQAPAQGEPKEPSHVEVQLHLILQLKLIAKIAHGYATYRYGIDGFDPFLTDFIRGQNFSNPSFLIGGEFGPIPPPIKGTWHIKSSRLPAGNLVLVRVRLFAHLGAPVYVAVVGKHKPDSARLESYERLNRK
jgi:hypothetical protein